MIAISDHCYCIRDWDKWLEDTNMGDDVSDDVVLIDKMGGDGVYEVNLELTKKEDSRMTIKRITVQQGKDRRIAKKIAELREDWRQTLKENKKSECDICEARFQYYIKGLEDAYGFEKVDQLFKLSKEDLK